MSKFVMILLILVSASAFAEINKWVDSQGQVHYSDEPPPVDVQAQSLRPVSGTGDAAGSGVNATKSVAEMAADLKRDQLAKQAAADKAAQQQAIADALKINCDNAQQNLRTLQSGGRMAEIDASGERSYISDSQRQQRIDKAQQYISSNCK